MRVQCQIVTFIDGSLNSLHVNNLYVSRMEQCDQNTVSYYFFFYLALLFHNKKKNANLFEVVPEKKLFLSFEVMNFFDPYKEANEFCDVQKKKVLRMVFLVFYAEELHKCLQNLVILSCLNCNQDIPGKEAPIAYPHTCKNFETSLQAFEAYGARAMSEMDADNKTRWHVYRKWWDFVFDLTPYSRIKEVDFIDFGKQDLFLLKNEWQDDLRRILGEFRWADPNNLTDMLKQITKW